MCSKAVFRRHCGFAKALSQQCSFQVAFQAGWNPEKKQAAADTMGSPQSAKSFSISGQNSQK